MTNGSRRSYAPLSRAEELKSPTLYPQRNLLVQLEHTLAIRWLTYLDTKSPAGAEDS